MKTLKVKYIAVLYAVFGFVFISLSLLLITYSLVQVKTNDLRKSRQSILKVVNKNIEDMLKLGVYSEVKRYCNNLKNDEILKNVSVKLTNGIQLCDTGSSIGLNQKIFFDEGKEIILGEINIHFKDQGFFTSLKNLKFFIFIIFISVVLFVYFSYRFLKSAFIRPITALTNYLEFETKPSDEIFVVEELKRMWHLIQDVKYVNEEKLKIRAQREIYKQVAHDIRSPLAALEIGISDLEEIEEQRRVIIQFALRRINDIASNLLEQGKVHKNGNVEPVLVSNLVKNIISEKRTQYNNKNVNIQIDISESAVCSFSKVDQVELKRIISNIVNNSAEAALDECRIKIFVDSDDSELTISIVDNGKGIPKEIIQKLGYEKISFGKEKLESGAGIGLYHAMKNINKWNGHLSIESEVEKYTKVYITLPVVESPPWFSNHITIEKDASIIILDDDRSIHEVWKKRLGNHKLIHFYSPTEFKRWFEVNQNARYVFLFDYEMIGFGITGLDLIREYELENLALLVSSKLEDHEVIEQCLKNNIRGFPKSMATYLNLSCS